MNASSTWLAAALLAWALGAPGRAENTAAPAVYDSVDALWAGFDPRALPVEPEILEEKTVEGVIVRTVKYTAEITDGFKVRVVGYYGFPVGGSKLPAILHVHGGGQNATLQYVVLWGRRGYATLSINWGGRPLEGKAGNPRTDWGPLRFNQDTSDDDHLYTLKPNARGNSWYHWAIAARRGLTFLEQQPEVNPDRLGEFGISMGGMITWLVAGTETRLKCAADVFGLEMLHAPLPGIPGSEYAPELKDQPLWPQVLDPIAYAPRIRRPFLFLSATNDIHARQDMVDQTLRHIPTSDVWQTYSLHLSHCSTPREAPVLGMWMDRWLKDAPAWPQSPALTLDLAGRNHEVAARIQVDRPAEVREVLVHYSTDPYPAGRFWRTVTAERRQGTWAAALPLVTTDEPLYAYADLTYNDGLAIASRLDLANANDLKTAGVKATQRPSALIDDFSHGTTDWFNPDGGANAMLGEREYFRAAAGGITWLEPLRNGWRIFTRKLSDPGWAPAAGAALAVTLRADRPNEFLVFVSKDDARPPKVARYYFATAKLTGGAAPQRLVFQPADFHAVYGGEPMNDWPDANLLGVASRYLVNGKRVQKPDRELGGAWDGPPPVLSRVEWSAERK